MNETTTPTEEIVSEEVTPTEVSAVASTEVSADVADITPTTEVAETEIAQVA